MTNTAHTATQQPPFLELGGLGLSLIENLPFGLVVFDRRLKVMHINPRAESILPPGDSIAEMLTEATQDTTYQDWAAELRGAMETRQATRFEGVPWGPASVGQRYITLLFSPLPDKDGEEVRGGMLVVEDVTARISMERRLAISERMAAVGQLASRVAHELNNPLDGILRYINLAQRVLDTPDAQRAEHYLAESRKGLTRMIELVGQLLEFSRSTRTAFAAGSINDTVEEAIRAHQDKAGEQGVAFVCDLQQKMPNVRGNNLFQVFCNLVKNALDAMPRGGRLTIRTRLADQRVTIEFEDTGVGLPADAERIFDAFYTTKPPGKGTGLGLAICRDLIQRYQGRIWAENRPQGGAVFFITIPLESCVPAAESDSVPVAGEQA